MWIYFLLFLTGFILVHFCKMMRLYLVLMEHGISFPRFVVMYLETTLVNLIVPFKIGEIFRVLVISKETKHWQVGILSVITDRFFDTLALCAILIPVDIWYLGRLSPITWIFLAILFIIVICYVSLMPTYGYLNRYIIMSTFSFMGWFFEIGTLAAFATCLKMKFDVGDFINYIQAIFAFGSSRLLNKYTGMSILLMGIAAFIGIVVFMSRPERKVR